MKARIVERDPIHQFMFYYDSAVQYKETELFHKEVQTADSKDSFLGIYKITSLSATDFVCQRFTAGEEKSNTIENQRLTMLGLLKKAGNIRQDNSYLIFFLIAPAPIADHDDCRILWPRRQLWLIDTNEGRLQGTTQMKFLSELSSFLNTPLIHLLTDDPACDEWRQEMLRYQNHEFIVAYANSNSEEYFCQRVYKQDDVEAIEEARKRTIQQLEKKAGKDAQFVMFESPRISINRGAIMHLQNVDSEGRLSSANNKEHTTIEEFLQNKITGGYSFPRMGNTKNASGLIADSEDSKSLISRESQDYQYQPTSCCSCLPVILELFRNNKTAIAAILFLVGGGLGGAVAFYLLTTTVPVSLAIGGFFGSLAAGSFLKLGPGKSTVTENVPSTLHSASP